MHPERANITLQSLDKCALTVGIPTAKLEPSIGAISLVLDLQGQQKHTGKADRLTLASADSEHA